MIARAKVCGEMEGLVNSDMEIMLSSEHEQMFLSRRCLCDKNGECFYATGLCSEEHLMLVRSPRSLKAVFKTSTSSCIFTPIGERSFELLPVIDE